MYLPKQGFIHTKSNILSPYKKYAIIIQKDYVYLNHDSLFILRKVMEEKKERLLEAALEVFSDVGYHNAKISKIAEIAGIGAGSVYLYFENKENILEEIFKQLWTRLEKKLEYLCQASDMNAKQKFSELIHDITLFAFERKEMAKIVLHEYRFWRLATSASLAGSVRKTKNMIADIIREGINTGIFRNDMNPDNLTNFLFGGIWYFLAEKSGSLMKDTIDTVTKEIEMIIFDGMC